MKFVKYYNQDESMRASGVWRLPDWAQKKVSTALLDPAAATAMILYDDDEFDDITFLPIDIGHHQAGSCGKPPAK